ncbi:MAG: peptidylprolyl isomerase [Rhodospirillaceae bacterium]|jgi:peptidyl-prolyl cis-trans isomerase SurA|nr:peptidylprolyl isomerase [Rhodospirillaceae bacterium]MBT5811115.1 peptidylprolyl isomerase [Rhodospirillaceae bacterium]
MSVHKYSTRNRLRAAVSMAIFSIALMAIPTVSAQNVLRIAAVVNDRVVSALDVVHRMRFVIISTRLPNTPETRKKLTPQIIRGLIDEQIQLQEADHQNIRVSEREIDKSIRALEKQNNLPTGKLKVELARMGTDISTLRDQIKARIAWSKTVSRRLRREIQINAEDIDEELSQIKKQLGQPQFRVSEIFLSIDNPDQDGQVRATALRLLEQLKNGAEFSNLARAFSQNTSASLGGDLGWIQRGRLDQALDDAIGAMSKGQTSDPIRSFSGYHILKLREIRQPAGKGDAVVSLRQVVLRKDGGPALREKATAIRKSMSGCDKFDDMVKAVGAPASGSLGKVKISELPENLRDAVKALQVGEFGAPVTAASGDDIMFIVCDRQEKKVKLPKRADIRKKLLTGKLERLSQRYLRDLRRAAFIDLRN